MLCTPSVCLSIRELNFSRYFASSVFSGGFLFNRCENHSKKILFVIFQPLLKYGTIQKSSGKTFF